MSEIKKSVAKEWVVGGQKIFKFESLAVKQPMARKAAA
jgi:hypothetical protein